MKYAEIIFETGSKSLMSFDDEESLKSFLVEHTRRAMQGDVGGPTGHPAERIKKVLVYSDNPGDLHADGLVPVDAVQKLVSGMEHSGLVNVEQLMSALRDEVSPTYPLDQGRHASLYKAEEDGELDLAFLNTVGGE